MHSHPYDQFNYDDGTSELREATIIEGNKELTGSFMGSICVHDEASFGIASGSEHMGSMTFQPGSTGDIRGRHVGTITVLPNAEVQVWGRQEENVKLYGTGKFTVMGAGAFTGTIQHR